MSIKDEMTVGERSKHLVNLSTGCVSGRRLTPSILGPLSHAASVLQTGVGATDLRGGWGDLSGSGGSQTAGVPSETETRAREPAPLESGGTEVNGGNAGEGARCAGVRGRAAV